MAPRTRLNEWTPATLSRSAAIDLEAVPNGVRYRLKVAIPATAPPPGGYPTLVVLDGDAYFGMATDISRNLSTIGGEIPAALVVGIGYADDDPDAWQTRRALDLTPTGPGPDEDMLPDVAYGGLNAFLEAFDRTLWPSLALRWPLDESSRVLYGHSFGGLAVVRVLLTRPDDFAGFIAISPSLQWNDGVVLEDERAFAARFRRSGSLPRVFLAAGELEDVYRPARPSTVQVEARRRRSVERARIVATTCEFARRLQSINAAAARQVRYLKVAAASHVSAPYAALPIALCHTFPLANDGSASDV